MMKESELNLWLVRWCGMLRFVAEKPVNHPRRHGRGPNGAGWASPEASREAAAKLEKQDKSLAPLGASGPSLEPSGGPPA